MRFVLVLLAALAASGSAFAGDQRPSQTACDGAKIGARDLADCLRTNSDRAERDLAVEADAAVKSIDTRMPACSTRKSRAGSARSTTPKHNG